ncbi:MAG: mercuric reductase, partial [Nitrospirae bacterium]|nr:mercuric reductase [Nitrospirota bacterium]
IEKNRTGGDCLNTGCVPSKGILRVSKGVGEIRRSSSFGIQIPGGVAVDFPKAMERMRKLRAEISQNDSVERFRQMGVDVFLGEGKFLDRQSIQVSGTTLNFSKGAICTGARPAIPAISGLNREEALTSENLFNLTTLPARLAIIGAGPIGSEMAQAFRRFGSEVFLFDGATRILPREDKEAAILLQEKLIREGVRLYLGSKIVNVESDGSDKVIHYEWKGEKKEQRIDKILVSTGRTPNVNGLGLEEAGIKYDSRSGIHVNTRLQTTNPRVYAAGDVCFPYHFTHAADATAQILIQNALFPHPFGIGYAKTGDLVIPRCTYTDPEIAFVGRFDETEFGKTEEVETVTVPLSEVDRAILDGEEEGFVRIHLKKGSNQIVAATLVASHAGEMINEITMAMKSGAGISLIGGTIHPYPTQAEAIRKAANLWRKKGLTESKRNLLKRWFSLSR